jgi:hypothetical protein
VKGFSHRDTETQGQDFLGVSVALWLKMDSRNAKPFLSEAQNESFRANCQVRASEVVLVISPKSESVGVVIGVPRLG